MMTDIVERLQKLQCPRCNCALNDDGTCTLMQAAHDIERLRDENASLRAALKDARDTIAGYWPLSTPEKEPEKSTIAVLNKIDAAMEQNR